MTTLFPSFTHICHKQKLFAIMVCSYVENRNLLRPSGYRRRPWKFTIVLYYNLHCAYFVICIISTIITVRVSVSIASLAAKVASADDSPLTGYFSLTTSHVAYAGSADGTSLIVLVICQLTCELAYDQFEWCWRRFVRDTISTAGQHSLRRSKQHSFLHRNVYTLLVSKTMNSISEW